MGKSSLKSQEYIPKKVIISWDRFIKLKDNEFNIFPALCQDK